MNHHTDAGYFIVDAEGNEIGSGELGPGCYRLHNGKVEIKNGFQWQEYRDQRDY